MLFFSFFFPENGGSSQFDISFNGDDSEVIDEFSLVVMISEDGGGKAEVEGRVSRGRTGRVGRFLVQCEQRGLSTLVLGFETLVFLGQERSKINAIRTDLL